MSVNDLITLLLANKTITPEMWQAWLDLQNEAGIRTDNTMQFLLLCITVVAVALIVGTVYDAADKRRERR